MIHKRGCHNTLGNVHYGMKSHSPTKGIIKFRHDQLSPHEMSYVHGRGGHSIGILCTTCGGGVFV